MSKSSELKDRYRQVMDRVAQAAARADRKPSDVLVVAVTKYAAPDQIRQLIEFGHADLGENRVQQLLHHVAMTEEFLARYRTHTSPRKIDLPKNLRWHMVGSLQRNKVKPVLPLVKLVHSIDSLRIAEEIQTQAARQEREIDVLIQLNTSGEKTKSGVSLPAAPHLAEQMQSMFNVRLRGLMTMAPYSTNPEDSRPIFERTAELFREMQTSGNYGDRFNILSMGMTDDFEIAIECGANMLRIGRAFFGETPHVES